LEIIISFVELLDETVEIIKKFWNGKWGRV